MMMHSSPALTSHARIFINARRRIGARRPYIRAQASSVDGAMERIVAWTALDVENKRTLNSGVPESIQRDIDALIADGRVDGGIENAVQGDGVWEVFSAPHIKRLAAPVGVIFSPLRYVIDQGNIYSHVRHRGIVPDGWLSASGVVVQGVDMLCQGRMRPSCVIWFDKFWIGASLQTKDEPREFPTENEASALDVAINKIGNAGFLDGLARFPLLFYDEKQGLVIFQFPPLNSNICAMRRN
jgi:hypothetical protein